MTSRLRKDPFSFLAGLGPAIHDTRYRIFQLLVDARPEAGHERQKQEGSKRWR